MKAMAPAPRRALPAGRRTARRPAPRRRPDAGEARDRRQTPALRSCRSLLPRPHGPARERRLNPVSAGTAASRSTPVRTGVRSVEKRSSINLLQEHTMAFTGTGKVWMNGVLVDWPDAKIHVASHVIHYGSAVFEGARCYETSARLGLLPPRRPHAPFDRLSPDLPDGPGRTPRPSSKTRSSRPSAPTP